jgi:voltage-gated potassium channel
MSSAERLEQWESRSEWVLTAVAVAFLVAYSIQVLSSPVGAVNSLLNSVMTLLYLAFIVDYVVRLVLAPQRRRWFFRHLFDLAIVALPVLRPLRLLRLLVLIKVMQRAGGDAIRGRVAVYAASSAVLFVYVASLAMLQTERSAPDSTITSFGDAIWWAVTTVTTVGYGDTYPVTVTGRVIAGLLMIGGISLIGVITATVASWIVERVSEGDSANRAATAAQMEELRDQIHQLSAALRVRDETPENAWSHR